jgi:hypothetical protein
LAASAILETDASKTLVEQEDDLVLDYEDDLHPTVEDEDPVVVPTAVVNQPLSKIDALAEVVAGVKREWQEFTDSFKSSTESSKKKKLRLGRTPSPVPQKSDVLATDVSTPPASPTRAESASSVFRSAVSLVAPRKRTSVSLATTKLDDPSVKPGSPFEPAFLKLSDKMFGRSRA